MSNSNKRVPLEDAFWEDPLGCWRRVSPWQVTGFSLKAAFLPVHRRDARAIWRQFGIMRSVLSLALEQCDLLDRKTAPQSIRGILAAGRSAWRAKWGKMISQGWRDGKGGGLFGYVGSLASAIQQAGPDFVRDTSALLTISTLLWASYFALAAILLFASGIAGVAFAQAPIAQFNTGGGASGDLAAQALGHLLPFLGAGTALAQGLGQISAILCTVAMTIAGFSIIASTAIMGVAYLENPETFKQHHSIYFFLARVVIAIGLLVPLGGGWDGGQQVVGKLALWGSDKATTAWVSAARTISNPQGSAATSQINDLDIQATLGGLVSAEACAAAVNQDPVMNQTSAVVFDSTSGRYDQVFNDGYGNTWTQAGACGTIVASSPSISGAQGIAPNAVTAVIAAQGAALAGVQAQIRSFMTGYAAQKVAARDQGMAQMIKPPSTALVNDWIQQYRGAVQANVSAALTNNSLNLQVSQSAAQWGWVGAGVWAVQMSQLTSSLDGAANSLPRVAPGTVRGTEDFVEGVTDAYAAAVAASGTPSARAQQVLASGASDGMDWVFQAAAGNLDTIFANFNAQTPLSSMATLGHWVYGTALGMQSFVLTVKGISALTAGGGAEGKRSAAGTLGSFVSMIPGVGTAAKIIVGASAVVEKVMDIAFMPMMAIGVALAYYVPSLPFIRLFLGVLAWLVALMETIFLIPCALALMINTQNSPFLPPVAQAALWHVVALIFRPFLTLAGFYIGLMLMSEAIGLENVLIVPLIRSNEAGSAVFFGFLAYLAIYAGLAWVLVNTCTKVAEILPAAVYRWLNANSTGERDDAAAVANTLANAGRRFGA